MTPEFININFLILGFMGGFFRIFMEPKPPAPWELVRYTVVGGFVANFFMPLLLVIVEVAPQIVAQIQIPEAVIKGVPWAVTFWIGTGGLRIGRWVDRGIARGLKHIERMKNE